MKTKQILLLLVWIAGGLHSVCAQNISLVNNMNAAGPGWQIMESFSLSTATYFTTYSPGNSIMLWRLEGTAPATIVHQWPSAYGNEYAPLRPAILGTKMYFPAYDSAHGMELWISDGTAAGTQMLVDICPGTCSGGNSGFFPDPVINDKLYFVASDVRYISTLWETDGSAGGTRLAYGIDSAAPFYGVAACLPVMNNRACFVGGKDVADVNLYASDGSQAGTEEIQHRLSGVDYTSWNGKLLFNRAYPSLPPLWITDGTKGGTYVLDPLVSVSPDNVPFHNELYFISAQSGNKLYATDGTAGSVRIVRDIPYLTGNNSFSGKKAFPVAYDNHIFFCGKNELWKSDGTTNGTVSFKTFSVDTDTALLAFPGCLTVANGKLYFKAFDTARTELFITDGTAMGTYKIGVAGANYNDPARLGTPNPALADQMIVDNDQLYFTAIYDTTIGKALYRIALPTGVAITAGTNLKAPVISPNPTSGIIHIRYPKDASFTTANVYDAAGRSVHTQSTGNKGYDAMILSALPSGNYVIRFSGNGQAVSVPLVIQR